MNNMGPGGDEALLTSVFSWLVWHVSILSHLHLTLHSFFCRNGWDGIWWHG